MHVKAFGLMTRHPVKLEALPPDLRDEAPTDDKGRVERPSREFRGEVFRRFLEALEPLRSEGKLGGILFQFPSYVVYKDRSLEYLQWAREQLGDDEMLVEFRHISWFDDEHRDETLRFLEELGAANVIVDSPRIEGAKNIAPTVLALTSPTAYVRFHGRNAETWNKRGGSASERFDYLYSDEELRGVGRPASRAFRSRRSRRTRSSTTTPRARTGAADGWRRRPRTPRNCSACCSRRTSRSAPAAQS